MLISFLTGATMSFAQEQSQTTTALLKAGDMIKAEMTMYKVVSASQKSAVLELIPEEGVEVQAPAYYIDVCGQRIFADKKDVMALKNVDKSALFAFMREQKTKWDEPSSLQVLGDFLYGALAPAKTE